MPKVNAAAFNHGIMMALACPGSTPDEVNAKAADFYGQTPRKMLDFLHGHGWGVTCRRDGLDHRTGRPRIVTPATPQRAAEAPVIAWPGC